MKKFVIFLSVIGIGTLIVMETKRRKRRRLLEINKVSEDLGGTVPGPLYRYLKSLGDENKTKGDLELFGYKSLLELSRIINKSMDGDILVILGINKALSEELGKKVYLMYSKKGYPDSLIYVTLEETGDLEYYSSVNFGVL